jgi:hypothetical protein
MNIKEIEIVETSQNIYDNFNGFILSKDIKVFGKLLARSLLLDMVKDIPGDIVECGVFKGTGLLTFLKLKRYLCPNTCKKVIGFDFFNSKNLLEGLIGIDKEGMSTLFNDRNFKHEENYVEFFSNNIKSMGFKDHEFELVAGDISKTASKFVSENPGFRISMLYIDLDLGVPTYDALSAMWDKVVKGGIVVFDEYGFHKWTESEGVDKFFKNKNVKLKSLNYICPTAYIVKQ